VLVQRNNETIIVRVQDDGIGLGSDQQAGFGIRNMRDRARLLDGKLRLEHREGGGTLVELEAPLRSDS
jgi:two-component system sensor histidine kinase UhpB